MKSTRKLKILSPDTTYDIINTPIGELTLIASSQGLLAILWDTDQINLETRTLSKQNPYLVAAKKQLAEYLEGNRTIFDLPLIMKGTPFQLKAWQQLLEIPYGQTISYAQQAGKLGDRNKARAVGTANKFNLLSIIVPCHRVIGANGKLAGFAGGILKKEFLINLEKTYKSRISF